MYKDSAIQCCKILYSEYNNNIAGGYLAYKITAHVHFFIAHKMVNKTLTWNHLGLHDITLRPC